MIGDTGVYFGGFATRMAQEFLDVSQVYSLLKEVGGKAVPKGVGSGMFANIGFLQSLTENFLYACGTVLFALWAFKKPVNWPVCLVVNS